MINRSYGRQEKVTILAVISIFFFYLLFYRCYLDSALHKLPKSKKPDLLIIDYLQLMDANKREASRAESLESLLKDLKQIAVENNLVLVVLTQLRRAQDERVGNRPRLCDFRVSSGLSLGPSVSPELFDKGIFLYRNSYYNSEIEDSTSEFHIVKNKGEYEGAIVSDWDMRSIDRQEV